MSITRSITLNDITATVSFDTKLASNNQSKWSLTVTSGTNKVSTNGAVTMELSAPKVDPVTTPVVAPVTSWPISMIGVVDDNKAKHVAFIKESLDTISTATGRDSKTACAKMLFDYLSICGMDFIKAHDSFKLTVINKAYELKKEAPEKASMVASMNKVLTTLGQPLEKKIEGVYIPPDAFPSLPVGHLTRQVACGGSLTYCGCPGCPDLTIKPTTEKKDESYNPDMALFITLAKKYDAKNAIKNPKLYFSCYENEVKWGTVKGSTKAERMNYYLSRQGDTVARESLMKQLFEKNNLVFGDSVMTLYDEWQKTYKPNDVSNRYKKMCAFIDVHKSLFTA